MPKAIEPPKRRRFFWLRLLFFAASLPLVWWVVTRYGSSALSYAQSYPGLTGFWFWFWTLLFAVGTWSVWRLVKRKWARAKELADELDAGRR